MSEKKRTPWVLLVIDCQVAFVNDNSRGCLPAIAELIQKFADAGHPIYATKFINTPGSQFERLIGWTKCSTPEETAITPELTELVEKYATIVEKGTYTFFTRHWEDVATAEGWENVVVVGIDTDSCVLKTAFDAFDHGLVPWVSEEATSSHSGSSKTNSAIDILKRNLGVSQITQSSYISHLIQNS